MKRSCLPLIKLRSFSAYKSIVRPSIWVSLSAMLLLTSCAKIKDISTNLDSKNFSNFFAPGHVKMYPDDRAFQDKNYEYLGLVEGENCQIEAHHAQPDPIAARTEARRQAYDLGANSVIFSSCVTIDETTLANSSCLSTVICYGSAYKVDWEEKK